MGNAPFRNHQRIMMHNLLAKPPKLMVICMFTTVDRNLGRGVVLDAKDCTND